MSPRIILASIGIVCDICTLFTAIPLLVGVLFIGAATLVP